MMALPKVKRWAFWRYISRSVGWKRALTISALVVGVVFQDSVVSASKWTAGYFKDRFIAEPRIRLDVLEIRKLQLEGEITDLSDVGEVFFFRKGVERTLLFLKKGLSDTAITMENLAFDTYFDKCEDCVSYTLMPANIGKRPARNVSLNIQSTPEPGRVFGGVAPHGAESQCTEEGGCSLRVKTLRSGVRMTWYVHGRDMKDNSITLSCQVDGKEDLCARNSANAVASSVSGVIEMIGVENKEREIKPTLIKLPETGPNPQECFELDTSLKWQSITCNIK